MRDLKPAFHIPFAMSANAADASKDVPKAFGFHSKEQKPFDGAEKIREWRGNISRLYPEIHRRAALDEGYEKKSTISSRGGLRVYIRKRPVLTEKLQENESENNYNYDTLSILNPFVFLHSEKERLGVKTGALKSVPYRFHGTFDETSSNIDVYAKACRPLVDSILSNESSNIENTIICYGQTGAGKTFTQVAMHELALKDIFRGMREGQKLSISFFENCGDRVFDLLNERLEMKIQEDGNGNVVVNGLHWHTCKDMQDALRVVTQGSQLRATHPTKNNPDSSRSHALCTFALSGTGNKVTFVDLAGSERKKDVMEHSQERIAEMQEINWSLGTLKQCVRDLIEKQSINPRKHLNFRNSKLTLLLKRIFVLEENKSETTQGRAAKNLSVFIGCVAPLQSDRLHTEATVKYMEELMSVDIYLQNRVATEEELTEHLQLFYLEYCPSKATYNMVKSILEKFKGQEQKLYKGLKRKYRHAPKVLLLSEGAIALQKNNPLKWSAQKLKGWIRKLQNGRFEQYADKFNMSGSKFFSLSVHDVIDRCGGGSHCAAFNDSEHALYAGSSSSTRNDVNGADEKLQMEQNAQSAKEIFEEFRKLRIAFNQ